MSQSRCDGCGKVLTDLDAGFSPGLHEMGHNCGGTWRAGEEGIIRERGNGLADVGDFVSGNDGKAYEVVELIGPIQTGRSPGAGHWQTARVKLVDWDDIDDDNEPVCSVEIGGAS